MIKPRTERRRDDSIIIPAIGADGALFPVEKLDAHRRGVKHMAVSVFVFCGEELLIQKRAADKYHCGGMWANTCCTHPYWDEPVADCAARRLREEVGLQMPLAARGVVDYRAAVTNGLVEDERVHIFEGRLAEKVVPTDIDAGEVAAVQWVTRPWLAAEIASRPEAFTPWLRIYLNRWNELALRTAA